MTAQDAYKWIYHASNGGEHAVSDAARASDWMDREWSGLDLDFRSAQAILTPLDPWGRIVRVNLRPAKRQEVKQDLILNWFIESAQKFQRDDFGFQLRWRVLGLSLRETKHKFPFAVSDWEKFELEAAAKSYPAVHHSPEYSRLNVPAYRVGLAELWKL